MGMFSALLALCEGNPSVFVASPNKAPAMWSFDVFFLVNLQQAVKQTVEFPMDKDIMTRMSDDVA